MAARQSHRHFATVLALLQEPSLPAAQALLTALPDPTVVNDAKLSALLAQLPYLITVPNAAPPAVQQAIIECCTTTIEGMIRFLTTAEEAWALYMHNLAELKAYSDVVGMMPIQLMTTLFILEYNQLEPQTTYLFARVPAYAFGLTLADFLEDMVDDLADHKRLLPCDASYEQIIALARQGLTAGEEYTLALQAAQIPNGVVAACAGSWASCYRSR